MSARCTVLITCCFFGLPDSSLSSFIEKGNNLTKHEKSRSTEVGRDHELENSGPGEFETQNAKTYGAEQDKSCLPVMRAIEANRDRGLVVSPRTASVVRDELMFPGARLSFSEGFNSLSF